ncbi:hypothetical protein [Pleomorphomonas sp. PLEO]|uniref:hypothetical protein n=1 Tax=Pleomorphomonas sp. PLEO TaxID=3239306 RepID=UPI00351E3B46
MAEMQVGRSGHKAQPVNPRTKLAALLWTASLVLFLSALPAFVFAALLLAATALIDRTLALTVLRRGLAIALPFTVAVVTVQTLLIHHPDSAPFGDPPCSANWALNGRARLPGA